MIRHIKNEGIPLVFVGLVVWQMATQSVGAGFTLCLAGLNTLVGLFNRVYAFWLSLFLIVALPFGWSSEKVFNTHVEIGFDLKLAEMLLLVHLALYLFDTVSSRTDLTRTVGRGGPYLAFYLACWVLYGLGSLFVARNFAAFAELRPLLFLTFYLLAYRYLDTPRRLKFTLMLIIGAMICYAVATLVIASDRNGFFQAIYKNTMWADYKYRTSFPNSVIYVIVIPLMLALYRLKKRYFMLMLFVMTIFLASLVVSMTRLLFVCIFATVVCFNLASLPTRRKKLASLLWTGVGLCVFVGLAVVSGESDLVARISSFSSGASDSSFLTRIFSSGALIAQSLDKPLFGHGLGVAVSLVGPTGQMGDEGTFIDDTISTVFFKMGAFGLLLLVGFVAAYFKSFRALMKSAPPGSFERIFSLVLMSALPWLVVDVLVASAVIISSIPVITFMGVLLAVVDRYLDACRLPVAAHPAPGAARAGDPVPAR